VAALPKGLWGAPCPSLSPVDGKFCAGELLMCFLYFVHYAVLSLLRNLSMSMSLTICSLQIYIVRPDE